MTPLPKIMPAGDRERLVHAFGDQVEFYWIGAETDGRFVHGKIIVPPGGGPPLHYHTKEDEWFYVLQGRVSFYAEGQWTEIGPGARVSCPRQSVHAFRNVGDSPLELLVTISPSGFEQFFERCAAEFAKAGGPDHGRLIEIAGEFGIHFVTPE